MAVILDVSDYRLLQYSTVIDETSDCRVLEIFQDERKNGLTDFELEEKYDNSVVVFINQNKESWLSLARKEWRHARTIKKQKKIPCDLCDTSHNLMCFVSNRKNNLELNVGGTCVTTFGDEISKEHNGFIKNAQEQHNFEKIQKVLPTIRSDSENWNKYLDKTSIIIPDNLSKRYKDIGRNLRGKLNNAIKQADNEKLIHQMELLLLEGEEVKKQINRYCVSHENDEFILTRELYLDIKKTQPTTSSYVIELLTNQPVVAITYQTAHRIQSELFLKKILFKIKLKLESIEILDVINGYVYYSLLKKQGYVFKTPTSIFLISFGQIAFDSCYVINEKMAIQEISNSTEIDIPKSSANVYDIFETKINKKSDYKLYNPNKDKKLNAPIKTQIKNINSEMNNIKVINDIKNNILNEWERVQKVNDESDLFYDRLNFYNTIDSNKYFLSLFKFEQVLNRKKLFHQYNSFSSKILKVSRFYQAVGYEKVSKDMEMLLQVEDYSNNVHSRNDMETLLLADIRVNKLQLEEKVKDLEGQILDYDLYKHEYVDFIDNEDNIYRVCKQEYILIARNYLLEVDSYSLNKLVKLIRASKKIDRDSYRRDAIISFEARLISV
ncbi:hypothetical protein [Vagococcus fluvialis]|uniref:Uncharacterized protein n=1 Tax=Vagococcus fluvialis TaxID=2738 RepID=A0A7X6D8D8_9ENTE|nr:hypothetical protein [Vagococcus fluvialis]NKC67353.1 hypothetical protein [Vagococcus fluvialis]